MILVWTTYLRRHRRIQRLVSAILSICKCMVKSDVHCHVALAEVLTYLLTPMFFFLAIVVSFHFPQGLCLGCVWIDGQSQQDRWFDSWILPFVVVDSYVSYLWLHETEDDRFGELVTFKMQKLQLGELHFHQHQWRTWLSSSSSQCHRSAQ